jgi:hypothetical protein
MRRRILKVIRKPPLLSINSPKKTRWDLFVIILATYNCFQIPIEVAFDPELLQQTRMKVLAFLIDIAFFLDILLSFRTTYINELNGQEVTD